MPGQGFGFYGFDIYLIILIVPAFIFTLIAQAKVKSTVNKYSQYLTKNGQTAEQICRYILDRNGLQHVSIGHVSGQLTDHYDPRSQVINLSDSTYGQSDISAIGIAAHEAGHACQYGEGYGLIKLRQAIIPITQIASGAAPFVLILGVILSWGVLIDLGIIFFAAAVFFQLVTLPVEYNASNRALKTLASEGILDAEELDGAKKVLGAAAMTYVAALVSSLASFLRILLLFGRRRD